MYATTLHCYRCNTNYPLTHRGSCSACSTTGEETALNETLGVQYNLASIKHQLDREELLPIIDPAFRIDLGAGGTLLAALTRFPEAVHYDEALSSLWRDGR